MGRTRDAFPNDSGLDLLLADTRLGSTAKTIACALVKHWAWSRDHCWPSDRTIASTVGKSTGHVQRCLRNLEHAGWIRRETTPETPNGRRIWLRWRQHADPLAASEGARELPAPARDRPPAPARDEQTVIVTQELKPEEESPTPRLRPEPTADTAPVAHMTARGLAPSPVEGTPVEAMPPPYEAPRPCVEPSPRAVAAAVRPGRRWPRLSLAELASAASARSDPILVAELARLTATRPVPAREVDVASLPTLELLARLPGRHDLVMAVARRLCVETSDEKAVTLRTFESMARSVASRSVPAEVLVSCSRQALGPQARERGKVLVAAWKRESCRRC